MTRDTARRVRFALEDFTSPVSTSSTLSSPGPSTPVQLYQPLVHVRVPSSAYSSSPSVSPNKLPVSIPCGIHGALVAPTFDFDVSLDPADNAAMRNDPSLLRIRTEPATNPPVPHLRLVSRHLPWEIDIFSSTHAYVTVSDVLGGLYRALRIPVREEEYARENKEKQDAVSRSYYRRFERHVSDVARREKEKVKGLKRVDFLMGAHRFRGLYKTDRPNVWQLKLKS